jgi:hypothetical protein
MIRGKGHGHRWLFHPAELDAVERWCTARDDSIFEAQVAQGPPATGHQPFAAWLVARKVMLIDDDHAKATPRGKKRRRGSGRTGANHRDIGVDGF